MTGRKGPEQSKISELIKGLVFPAQPPAHLFHESHAFIEAPLGSATSTPQQGLPPHPDSDTLLYALQIRAETRLLFVPSAQETVGRKAGNNSLPVVALLACTRRNRSPSPPWAINLSWLSAAPAPLHYHAFHQPLYQSSYSLTVFFSHNQHFSHCSACLLPGNSSQPSSSWCLQAQTFSRLQHHGLKALCERMDLLLAPGNLSDSQPPVPA